MMTIQTQSGRWRRLVLVCALFMGAVHARHTWVGTVDRFQASSLLEQTLNALANAGKDVDEIGVTPQGDWVIVAGQQVVASPGFPAFPLGKINDYIAAGKTVDVVSFAPNGSWVVVAGNLRWRSAGLPHTDQLADRIAERLDAGHRIQEIAFAPDGAGWTLLSGSYAQTISMPGALFEAVYDRRDSKRTIQGISTTPSGAWVLYADQWTVTGSAPTGLRTVLRNWAANRQSIDHVRLSPADGYIVYSNGFVAVPADNKPWLLEYSLNSGSTSIFERMKDLKVRGVSIAVIDDNKVVSARSYGLREWGTEKPVLAKTPFDAASLTKFITSSTAMRMIGHQYFKLSTDLKELASVNDAASQLYLWKSFGESIPAVFGVPPGVLIPNGMTLRRLLSHTAGAADEGPVGILPSQWPPFYPPLWQRLLSFNCDGGGCFYDKNNVAWYDPALGPPGTQAKYSNASYFLAQAMLERMGGNKPFPDLVKEHVLDPLGMNDSQIVHKPMNAAWEDDAAQQHGPLGMKLERRIYIWSGSGGLYTSARDYAKAMIPLMNDGKTESDADYLNPFAVSLMLQNNPPQGFYGLGLGLSAAQVTDSNGFFRHTGRHTDRARTLMVGRPDLKQGLVVLVNGGHDGAATLVSEIQEAFWCTYGWKNGC